MKVIGIFIAIALVISGTVESFHHLSDTDPLHGFAKALFVCLIAAVVLFFLGEVGQVLSVLALIVAILIAGLMSFAPDKHDTGALAPVPMVVIHRPSTAATPFELV